MIDTAVIMAAGKGTRFGSRTTDMPKGFIEFKGKSMIERSIDNLISAGINRIIIGTGYHKEWYERLSEKYPQIETVFSPQFAESNSMETLYQCRHAVGENDFLLLESDLVYEHRALTLLMEDIHPDIMLASNVTKFQDQYYIAVDENLDLLKCSTDKDTLIEETGKEPYGELVGIHKISNAFYQKMIEDYEYHRDKYIKRGYEFEIEDVASTIPMFVLKPKDLQWYEIDDEEDLKYAEVHVNIS